MKLNLAKLACIAAITAVGLGMPTASQAGLLNVNLSGVDVEYKGADGLLVDDDADAQNAIGERDDAKADSADAATLKGGDTILDMWMTPPDGIRADLRIESAPANLPLDTPTALTLAPGDTNEFLWYTGDGAYMRLAFNSLSVERKSVVPGVEIFLLTGGANVIDQGGLVMEFDDAVSFAYVATDVAFNSNGTNGMAVTGVASITGQMAIPEPSSLALISMLSLAGLGFRRVR